MSVVPFARTVVYRHPCDCPTASRPLEPGEHAEHRFDVDGEPFPWYVLEPGPTLRRLHNVYTVTVRMVPIARANGEPLHVTFDPDGRPSLGGREFPWALTSPLTFTASPDTPATLELTFIAQHVDADVDIPEEDTAP